MHGAAAIGALQDGDTVLISEGCTHHRQCEDIGTVKMPRWRQEYTGKELTDKKHGFELEKDEFTNVRIDYKVSGIGSASCGPEILDKYKMIDKNVHFAFSIIKNQED